jgi:hypothetical protein
MLPSVISTTSAPGLFQAFAAQWLAYVLPCRRFACALAGADARLGADADRYSFIAVDLHHLLPAGFDRRTESLKFRAREVCRYAPEVDKDSRSGALRDRGDRSAVPGGASEADIRTNTIAYVWACGSQSVGDINSATCRA